MIFQALNSRRKTRITISSLSSECRKAQLLQMCYYRSWDNISPPNGDHAQSTRNNTNPVVAGWQSWGTRIAMLEARIARIEARMDGLEAQMFFLQKALQVMCVLFLVALAYAICK